MGSTRITSGIGRGALRSTALATVALAVLALGAVSVHARLVTEGNGFAQPAGATWSLGDERAAPAMRVELERTVARAAARGKHLTVFGPPRADRADRRDWIIGAVPSRCCRNSGIETQHGKQLRSHLRLRLLRV